MYVCKVVYVFIFYSWYTLSMQFIEASVPVVAVGSELTGT